jgi:hypothetical protein
MDKKITFGCYQLNSTFSRYMIISYRQKMHYLLKGSEKEI